MQTYSLFREFSICLLYANVIFFILSLSEFFMQNIVFQLFEDIRNIYIHMTSIYLRGI